MSRVSAFRWFILSSALALCPAAAHAEPNHCSKLSESAGSEIRLDRITPDLRITRDGRPVPAESCMPLRRGDVVETRSSPVLIQFAEGLVLLMPKTRVEIGSIWSYFGELFSFGHVKVQDRYVTAGAEGTSYVFHSDADGNTVTVLQGHVRVTPNQFATPMQRLEAGQRVRHTRGASPSVTRLTPSEVTDMLRSYQTLSGYSAKELSQWERAFAPSSPEVGTTPGSTVVPNSTPGISVVPNTTPGVTVVPDTNAVIPRRGRDTASALVQGSFSFGGGGAPIEIGAGSLAFGWAHRFTSLGPLQLGSRVLGGATFGRYRSPMTERETGREEAAGDGTARLPFHGAFAKLDAELASNTRVVNVVGSLGLRGGWSHQRDVLSQADNFVWGPALSGRTEYTFVPGYRFLFELELWAQRTPVFACPIGCNEPAEPRPSIWQAWVGFALGVGVDL